MALHSRLLGPPNRLIPVRTDCLESCFATINKDCSENRFIFIRTNCLESCFNTINRYCSENRFIFIRTNCLESYFNTIKRDCPENRFTSIRTVLKAVLIRFVPVGPQALWLQLQGLTRDSNNQGTGLRTSNALYTFFWVVTPHDLHKWQCFCWIWVGWHPSDPWISTAACSFITLLFADKTKQYQNPKINLNTIFHKVSTH